ncbi:hypothetical protein GCM10027447_33230 [Glycomyces halotolerans]
MNPQFRASDAERRATVQALEQHTCDGRLTLTEFDERSERAWAARTGADLARLTSDLPATGENDGRSGGLACPAWRRGTTIALAAAAGVGLVGGLAQAAGAMPSGAMMCH